MAVMNKAVWIDGRGREPRVGPAETPEPGENEILLQTKAVAVQPGEWKIKDGIIPIPLEYPAIIGLSFSGIVEKVGPGVERFKQGDHVLTNSAGVIRNDHRFGAYQRFSLVPQESTAKIANTPFEEAASLATAYAPASALFLHLGLERPQIPTAGKRQGVVLIWGASSSFGAIAAQLASHAGYAVVGVAHGRNADMVKSLGVTHFIDRTSDRAVSDLIDLGPFKAVLAAADSAEDQVKIGEVLAAHGGGEFLSTMGVRSGVKLPDGVTGHFHQFVDDYLDPDNKQFTQWFWWDYLEKALANNQLKSVPLELKGGLSQVSAAWDTLRDNKVSGKRLIIQPELD
ncbi:Uncharacterized protein TPAR_08622 [Tolypocladium paradoxum]|uniref:Enoyl reductase (ER) domain-containing protein n=1 Tax=Tolypocladium paradoxum TaxID=94208 RepID=A0A2S4KLV7_9HYPO|nr:Uncharacterized protein TPAR_08622 [Tolypocladium paradoxum]